MLFGSKKGQSAMEYLMTYGWALLVIVVVIAVLMYINPFRAPQQCLFDQPGFVCVGNPFLTTNTNVMQIRLTNGFNNAITVLGVACVRGTAPVPTTLTEWQAVSEWTANSFSGDVPSKAEFSPQALSVTCTLPPRQLSGNTWDMSAAQATPNFQAGSDFNGRLYVMYTTQDEQGAGIPPRIAGANIVARVQ